MKTTKKRKQQKLLLVLPILAVPFITVLFWFLGGGGVKEPPVCMEKGLNRQLPQSDLPEEEFTKLHYYERAEKDSLKIWELRAKDPVFREADSDSARYKEPAERTRNPVAGASFGAPSQEKRIMQRLKALQKAVEEPSRSYRPEGLKQPPAAGMQQDSEIRRIEQMMKAMQAPAEEDKELQQINGMLESILDIQHPGRVAQRIHRERQLNRGPTYTVSTSAPENSTGALMQDPKAFTSLIKPNAFYGLEQEPDQGEGPGNAIVATVAELQTCVSGSTVKLRLGQDVFLKGEKIPKNTFIFGVAALNGERLHVTIHTIRYKNSLYPVELSLYDLDGVEGFFIPGAITREVTKASADRSIGNIGLTGLEDTWGAQAAGAGIQAAKSLFSKKVKQIKVSLKSGYKVLLRDKKTDQSLRISQ